MTAKSGRAEVRKSRSEEERTGKESFLHTELPLFITSSLRYGIRGLCFQAPY
jgi:hypothetical protein